MNIPFGLERTVDPVAGTTTDRFSTNRAVKLRGAFYFSATADWDDYWMGTRFTFSPFKGNPYSQVNADFNLRLTDTWFIGWDVLYAKIEPSTSAHEPGGTLINLGGHAGFTIRRSKPQAEKRRQ